jgi:hypothetical protein
VKRADDHPVVVHLNAEWRVIECRDRSQWKARAERAAREAAERQRDEAKATYSSTVKTQKPAAPGVAEHNEQRPSAAN